MGDLPFGGDDWAMEKNLAKIAEGDFDGVEFLMEDKAHRDLMVQWTAAKFADDIAAAKDGGASHINLQPIPITRTVDEPISYLVRCYGHGCRRRLQAVLRDPS